jgi:hypothetical protein
MAPSASLAFNTLVLENLGNGDMGTLKIAGVQQPASFPMHGHKPFLFVLSLTTTAAHECGTAAEVCDQVGCMKSARAFLLHSLPVICTTCSTAAPYAFSRVLTCWLYASQVLFHLSPPSTCTPYTVTGGDGGCRQIGRLLYGQRSPCEWTSCSYMCHLLSLDE